MSDVGFGAPVHTQTATIAAGTDPSSVIDLLHYTRHGFIFPAMTSIAVTFQVSATRGGTYAALTDADGTAISLAVTSSARAVGLDQDELDALSAFRFCKLVPGSSEVAARTITVVSK